MILKNISADDKKHEKLPSMQRVNTKLSKLVNMFKSHKLTFLRCGSSVGSSIDQENVLTTMARLVTIALVEQRTFVNEIFSAPESTYTENSITKISDYE